LARGQVLSPKVDSLDSLDSIDSIESLDSLDSLDSLGPTHSSSSRVSLSRLKSVFLFILVKDGGGRGRLRAAAGRGCAAQPEFFFSYLVAISFPLEFDVWGRLCTHFE
jgi:hypothetical protein